MAGTHKVDTFTWCSCIICPCIMTRSNTQAEESYLSDYSTEAPFCYLQGGTRGWLFIMACVMAALVHPSAVADDSNEGVFLVKPYLQLGDAPQISVREQIEVLWHTRDEQRDWSVLIKTEGSDQWLTSETVEWKRVAVENIPPHRVYCVRLADLKPGSRFDYRLLRDGNSVFTAHGKAKSRSSSRVVLLSWETLEPPRRRKRR